MRVVLIGADEARAALRARLPPGVHVIGEAASLAAARAAGHAADAWIVAPQRPLEADELSGPGLHRDKPGSTRRREAGEDGKYDWRSHETLTPRERDVLALLGDGFPNKRIAAALSMSPETVKFHVAQICGKLGVSNRTEAVRVAIRRGLLSI